jgi:hypothetical protein
MRVLGIVAALAVVVCASPAVAAASFSDKAFVNAAGSLMMVDRLRARCPAAAQPPMSAELAAWERDARVPDLRRAVAAARRDPEGDKLYTALDSALGKLLEPMAGQECQGLQRWLATPQARATWSGDVPAAAPAPPVRAASAARPPAVVPASAQATPAPRDIQGYGLILQYGLGYGGMVTSSFEPVVLFRSGDMLKDLKGLNTPGGASADRQANPKRWTRWRLAGGVYQWAQSNGEWGKIYNNKVWTSAPVTNLSGRYVATGGGGNTAMGGTDAVFVQTAFEFLPGGRVVRDGFASASSSVEGGGSRTSTVTGARQGPRTGRYSVDGVFMTIAYDDGSRERVTFMSYPTDPDIVWINGSDYVRKGR